MHPHRPSNGNRSTSNVGPVDDLNFKQDRVRLFQAQNWMTCFTTTCNVLCFQAHKIKVHCDGYALGFEVVLL